MSIRTVLSLASLLVPILTPVPIALRAQPATEAEPKLTPEEKVERENRRACKVAICAAFHNRRPEGGDIACKVTKTWRKQQLERMASEAKMSWPWGRVRCVADIKLRREMLIKAMSEPKYEAALDP